MGGTNKGNRWLGEVLDQCAWSAARSRDTYLAAQFWRLARRIGKKKAAVAVATPFWSSPGMSFHATRTTPTSAATTSPATPTPTVAATAS